MHVHASRHDSPTGKWGDCKTAHLYDTSVLNGGIVALQRAEIERNAGQSGCAQEDDEETPQLCTSERA